MNPDEDNPVPMESDECALPRDVGEHLIIPSQEILRGRREIWIEHGDEMYRLRVTANGKLYLTK